MGFAIGRPRLGRVVDGSKRSTANVLANAVDGLEDTSMTSKIQTLVRFPKL